MIHQGERGVPVAPRATLIGSTWVDGSTVRPTDTRGDGIHPPIAAEARR